MIFFIIKEIIHPTTKSKLIRMSGPPTFPVASTFAEVGLSQCTLLKAGIYTSPIDVEHHILPTFHRLGHNIVIYDNSTGCFHVVSAKIESSDYLFGVVEKDKGMGYYISYSTLAKKVSTCGELQEAYSNTILSFVEEGNAFICHTLFRGIPDDTKLNKDNMKSLANDFRPLTEDEREQRLDRLFKNV